MQPTHAAPPPPTHTPRRWAGANITVTRNAHSGREPDVVAQAIFISGDPREAEKLQQQLTVALSWVLPEKQYGRKSHLQHVTFPYWVRAARDSLAAPAQGRLQCM